MAETTPRPIIDPKAEIIHLRCCASTLYRIAEQMIRIYGSYRCTINGRKTQVVADDWCPSVTRTGGHNDR